MLFFRPVEQKKVQKKIIEQGGVIKLDTNHQGEISNIILKIRVCVANQNFVQFNNEPYFTNNLGEHLKIYTKPYSSNINLISRKHLDNSTEETLYNLGTKETHTIINREIQDTLQITNQGLLDLLNEIQTIDLNSNCPEGTIALAIEPIPKIKACKKVILAPFGDFRLNRHEEEKAHILFLETSEGKFTFRITGQLNDQKRVKIVFEQKDGNIISYDSNNPLLQDSKDGKIFYYAITASKKDRKRLNMQKRFLRVDVPLAKVDCEAPPCDEFVELKNGDVTIFSTPKMQHRK